jgi:hypothetical protein
MTTAILDRMMHSFVNEDWNVHRRNNHCYSPMVSHLNPCVTQSIGWTRSVLRLPHGRTIIMVANAHSSMSKSLWTLTMPLKTPYLKYSNSGLPAVDIGTQVETDNPKMSSTNPATLPKLNLNGRDTRVDRNVKCNVMN